MKHTTARQGFRIETFTIDVVAENENLGSFDVDLHYKFGQIVDVVIDGAHYEPRFGKVLIEILNSTAKSHSPTDQG